MLKQIDKQRGGGRKGNPHPDKQRQQKLPRQRTVQLLKLEF